MTLRGISSIASRIRGERQARLGRAQQRFILSALIPCVAFYLIFRVYPLLDAFNLSFRKYNIITPEKPFVGFDNYVRIFHNALFWKSIQNTFYYAICATLGTLAVALFFALIINAIPRLGQLFRGIFFLPQLTSSVAVAMVWMWLYQPVYGLLNQFLKFIGLPVIGWLRSPTWAMPSLIILGIWGGIGMSIIILLAGLTSIPRQYYEACRIDGGSGYHQFRYITLPLLRPTLTFMLVTGFMGSFNVFGSVFVMTGGGPLNATRTLAFHIYERAFQSLKMGEASAAAFVLFIIVLGVTVFQLRVLRTRWEF